MHKRPKMAGVVSQEDRTGTAKHTSITHAREAPAGCKPRGGTRAAKAERHFEAVLQRDPWLRQPYLTLTAPL